MLNLNQNTQPGYTQLHKYITLDQTVLSNIIEHLSRPALLPLSPLSPGQHASRHLSPLPVPFPPHLFPASSRLHHPSYGSPCFLLLCWFSTSSHMHVGVVIIPSIVRGCFRSFRLFLPYSSAWPFSSCKCCVMDRPYMRKTGSIHQIRTLLASNSFTCCRSVKVDQGLQHTCLWSFVSLCLTFFLVIFCIPWNDFFFSLNIAVWCRLIKEFSIKVCKECCFSHGGQYFAAVNGNTISIYNTYTFDNVGNLRFVTKPTFVDLPKIETHCTSPCRLVTRR